MAPTDRSEDGGFFNWAFFKTWYPFEKLKHLNIFIAVIGAGFLILAIVQISLYSSVREYSAIYADHQQCVYMSDGQRCQATITIPEDLKPPILFLYTLENTYMNHRGYLNSKNPAQLSGQVIDAKTASSTCAPFVINSDLGVNQSYGNVSLPGDLVASPCGFIAWLEFNDTFRIYSSDGTQIPINENDVDLKYNQEGEFNRAPNSQQTQWSDPLDPHFIVWMESQALLSKYKLWGKIDQNLTAGNYTLVADNNFQIGDMGIKKGVHLVVPCPLGGKILFFPIMYVFITLACLGYLIFINVKLKGYDQVMERMNMVK